MTLEEAFLELMNSEEYRSIARDKDSRGSKYRTYGQRFKRGELKAGAIAEMLLQHGYKITANKATKKRIS